MRTAISPESLGQYQNIWMMTDLLTAKRQASRPQRRTVVMGQWWYLKQEKQTLNSQQLYKCQQMKNANARQQNQSHNMKTEWWSSKTSNNYSIKITWVRDNHNKQKKAKIMCLLNSVYFLTLLTHLYANRKKKNVWIGIP